MADTLKLINCGVDSAPMIELAHTYIDGRFKRGEIGKGTRSIARNVLGAFCESFGNRDVAKLGLADIHRWQESVGHLSPGTRRTYWAVVRCFTRWLCQQRHIKRDPLANQRAPRVPRSVGRALTADECAAIEAALPDERAWAMYALMRWVGLRRAEVLSIQVADWDQRAGTLFVVGKGGHERIEPVPPWVAERLTAYLLRSGAKSGPLIRTHDGRRGISLTHMSKMMDRWMREADVKKAPFDGRACHSLRHTIASELIESGADVRVVQELLGHASLTSTQVYLRRATAGRVLAAMEMARAA